MRYLYLIFPIIIFSGCRECPAPKFERQSIVVTKCPKFDTKLKIKIEDLNSTHGAISWKDVSRIESFLKSKKHFNSNVDALNAK